MGALLAAALAVAPVAPAAAGGDRMTVVAAFYPLAEAVERVGGRHVEVENLTPAGTEPHDLELTTDEVDEIEDADLVVVLGGDFQPAIEDAARDRDGPTLDVLARLPGAHERDPHVWLDPELMRVVVARVEAALAKVDPEHAAAFARNAEQLESELSALDEEYRAGLAQCERDLVVTAHAAFGYVTDRYGLRQESVAGISPDAEPDPERLAELADLAEARGVTTVFTEELVSPRIARTLAREAGGLRTAVLSPLEGLTDDQLDAGDDYLSVMRDNLRKLRRALGCT